MKKKRELVALSVLVVIAATIWWSYFRGDKPAAVIADVNLAAQNFQSINVESPRLRLEEINRARKTEYKSAGRNPFSAAAPPPSVTPRSVSKTEPAPQFVGPRLPPPVPPPQVPPLPVKFFGFGTVPGGTTRIAFFTNGEDVFVVPEGELLMNRFRILKISNANLDYEEISSGLRGTAPLEEQAGVGVAVPGGPSA
jgi:hypothetical protein